MVPRLGFELHTSPGPVSLAEGQQNLWVSPYANRLTLQLQVRWAMDVHHRMEVTSWRLGLWNIRDLGAGVPSPCSEMSLLHINATAPMAESPVQMFALPVDPRARTDGQPARHPQREARITQEIRELHGLIRHRSPGTKRQQAGQAPGMLFG